MIVAINSICIDCRWFKKHNVDDRILGVCCRHSPAQRKIDNVGVWPIVNETEGCGDFEEKSRKEE